MTRSAATDSRLGGGGMCGFCFPSRRRHTRVKCDWSSDVCSSDLQLQHGSQFLTMLFDSIRKELTAVVELVPPVSLAAAIKVRPTTEEMRTYLQHRLGGLWRLGWRKARNKKPRRYGPKKKGSGAHTSVYRLLEKHKTKPKT